MKKIVAMAMSAAVSVLLVPTLAFGASEASTPFAHHFAKGCGMAAAKCVNACYSTICNRIVVPSATPAESSDAIAAPRNGNGANVNSSTPYRYNAEACPGYTDANGDGVCDYAHTGCTHAAPYGNGYGYIDENGDGICDNAGSYSRNNQNSQNSQSDSTQGYVARGGHHGGGHGAHHKW